MTIRAMVILGCIVFGCSKKADKDGKDGDKPGTGQVAKTPDAAAAQPAELTRLFACDFVAWDGEGESRQAKFALTNKGKKPVKRVQTWIYYFKKGEQFDRYPHALAQPFDPGSKVELALGSKGSKIKADTDAVACEITEGTYADGETWSNLNLNYNRLMIPRPVEGETHEQLLARTGVAVKPTWKGNKEGAAQFELANVKGRPLRARTAWVYYYDVDGKQLGRAVSNLMLELAVGAKVEQELGYKGDKIPEGTAVIEATVSVVEMTDGAKEKWINRNLSPFERPMVAKPPGDPDLDEAAADAGAKPE